MLETIEEEMHDTNFYRGLQSRLVDAESDQYASETQMREHMIRLAEEEEQLLREKDGDE